MSHFEEPLAAYDYQGYAQLQAALDMPIAAGEQEYTRWQYMNLISEAKVDILQPDVIKTGDSLRASRSAILPRCTASQS